MIYERIVGQGTLEEPNGVPEPRFALGSTLNWMRALKLLVHHHDVSFAGCREFYKDVPRRDFTPQAENTIIHALFLSLHQLSALNAFKAAERQADVARMGIVAWYYGIYWAANAMLTAMDHTMINEAHKPTARQWDAKFAARGLAMEPFHLRVTTLVEKDYLAEVAGLKAGSTFELRDRPITPADALGACCGYLSGSADYYGWQIKERLLQSPGFKKKGLTTFRTAAARQLRDEALVKDSVGFVHMALRYRGKANYREALFLGHAEHGTETQLTGFVSSLALVLAAFVSMAGAYVSRRFSPKTWGEFVKDADAKRAFSTSAASVWSPV